MPFDRAAWGRDYRRRCREQGRCCQCLKPAVQFGCCEEHAERKRAYNRALQRQQKGCQPRYPTHPEWGTSNRDYLWASEWQRPWYEYRAGRWWRTLVEGRDPLMILLAKEAAGRFCFLRDRRGGVAC